MEQAKQNIILPIEPEENPDVIISVYTRQKRVGYYRVSDFF